MSASCSPYELQRAANIAANKRSLDALGLSEPQLRTKRSRAKPRVPPTDPQARPIEPTRRSSRGVAAVASDGTKAAPAPRSELPPWQLAVFVDAERAMPATSPPPCTFDARRHHQHLERSASGRSIATTGVAGYGVALVAKRTTGTSLAHRAWEVVAVRFGVGGFGVGVVRCSMRPPYKSIGKSPDALGAYLANGSWAHAGVEVPFGPAYVPGDRIGVTIRPAGWTATKVTKATTAAREIVFFLNGKEVGVAASSLGTEELQLAVQPYMGGVALLTKFDVNRDTEE